MGMRCINGVGSPPLVRERQDAQQEQTVQGGITPARAGKTCIGAVPCAGGWDHPRSCGKDENSRTYPVPSPGSPPLVRERPSAWASSSAGAGITPARAGKTPVQPLDGLPGQDHPRSCGKDQHKSVFERIFIGSPPLVRERLP